MPSSSSRTTSTHLAVGLQPDEAVDHVDAGVLQLLGPGDVGLLVEAGLQLDQRRHLLAPLGGADQAATIGLSPEVRYSVILMASTRGSSAAWSMNASTEVGERLVGVVHEDVALAQDREDAALLLDRRPSRAG